MKHAKLAILGLFVTSVLLSGCTAPAKTTDAGKETPKTVKQEDSAQYSSVGSWIPRKVKKKEDVLGTNTQTVSAEALQKVDDRSSTLQPRDGPAPTGR